VMRSELSSECCRVEFVETSPDFVERVSDRSRVAQSVRRTLELSVLSGERLLS